MSKRTTCDIERFVGMEFYITEGNGIKGKLRDKAEDFVVNELAILPPKKSGPYVIVKMRVKNWEANRLIREISKILHISRHRISFAGTKDKRCVKTQYLSIRCNEDDLKKISISDVEILDYYISDEPIKIGAVAENEFNITVKHSPYSSEEIKKMIEIILEDVYKYGGFPNYFGIQRFGAVRPITHILGRHIAMRNYDSAVKMYISHPASIDSDEIIDAKKEFLETGDARKCLKKFPNKLSFEKAMLNHLVKKDGDYVGALKSLPWNLLLMFIHSYQSYLFNKILSERIRRGLSIFRASIGDVVVPIKNQKMEYIIVNKFNETKINEMIEKGRVAVSGLVPGYQPIFAQGEMEDIEKKILEEEKVESNMFIIPEIRRISSKGMRRALTSNVKDMAWYVSDNSAKFQFKLLGGVYATSFMREIMKTKAENY